MISESSKHDFYDDFSNGIWKKYNGNPVLVRTQQWWETWCICEPSILYEDGIFKMWYMGGPNSDDNGIVVGAKIGYATSIDGFTWEKYKKNPILMLESDSVIRPHVFKNNGMYYLFAVDKNQWGGPPTKMRRWDSVDGIRWENETIILSGEDGWEKNRVCNPAVIFDNGDGRWKMIYTNVENPSGFGYAYSIDGINWTKYEGNPVITGFYGGDPFLLKIKDKYYLWYSRLESGSLRIYCSWSKDMIHWNCIRNSPQIGYSQQWEHGLTSENGGSCNLWTIHLTDAALCEANGKVYMCYQGSQTPLGIATFDGTLEELAKRMEENPPLSKWSDSAYGCVENNELKISDNETEDEPIYENTVELSDYEGYMMEFKCRCYAGDLFSAHAVARYIDKDNFARVWLSDNNTTLYQEKINGSFNKPIDIGKNFACDHEWHDWIVVVEDENNKLYIDGKFIGECVSNSIFTKRKDLYIGFSVYDTYASFKNVGVKRGKL